MLHTHKIFLGFLYDKYCIKNDLQSIFLYQINVHEIFKSQLGVNSNKNRKEIFQMTVPRHQMSLSNHFRTLPKSESIGDSLG